MSLPKTMSLAKKFTAEQKKQFIRDYEILGLEKGNWQALCLKWKLAEDTNLLGMYESFLKSQLKTKQEDTI